MTLFLEASRPVLWRPWSYSSTVMVRFGWLWFAAGWLRVPFDAFTGTEYDWDERGAPDPW